MTALNFEALLAEPPALKQHTGTLPDGREYLLHQLPLSAIDKIGRLSRTAEESSRDLEWSEFGEIAAQSLLGRKPEPEEVAALVEKLGTDTVLHIYKDAIRFSQLGGEAVDEAKKD